MFGLSFWELAMILVVALLVLGPKRLPGLAKSVGKGLRELRRASSDLRSAIEEPLEEVRRPLQDLRDDLMDSVHEFGQEIEREATTDEGSGPLQLADPGQTEVEDRRQQVEELYAQAARADAAEDTAEPGVPEAGAAGPDSDEPDADLPRKPHQPGTA